jgi:FecR-like protein
MDLRKHVTLTRLLTILLSILAPMTRVVAQNMGRVGAVNQDATGTPPGESAHTLVVGAGVVYKETIKTTTAGSTQILFPDQSTLNIGRNSSMVIDEYVYEPKTGVGKMTASLVQGTMRFVGGQISHTEGVTITTPTATLGIRGGVASVAFPITPQLAASDPNLAGCSGVLVIGHVGTLILKNNAGEVVIRPGFAACVNGPNALIATPFRVSDVLLASIVSTLRSGPGQRGGASTPPATPFIVTTGVGGVRLNDPSHPPGADPFGRTSIFSFSSSVAKAKSQTTQLKNTAPPPYGGR